MEDKCYNHPNKNVLSVCHSCGRYFCSDCLTAGAEYYYCYNVQCQLAMQSEPSKDIEKQRVFPKESNPALGQVSEEDFVAFIGNNAHKYLSKFEKFNKGGFAATWTWHWPAFITPVAWLLYRKLYFWALIAFVLSIIPYFYIVVSLFFAVNANYIYFKHAKKKILELRTLQPSSDISKTLSQIGGINKWVITAAKIIGAIILIAMVVGAMFWFTLKKN